MDEALLEELMDDTDMHDFNMDDSMDEFALNIDLLEQEHTNRKNINYEKDDDSNEQYTKAHTTSKETTNNNNTNSQKHALNTINTSNTETITTNISNPTNTTIFETIPTQLKSTGSNNNTNTEMNTTDQTDNSSTFPNNNQALDNNNFIDIPAHLLTSFKILYALKIKLSKTQSTLENLLEHKNAKTLPPGLRIHHNSKHYLNKELRERWENTLTDASLALLDITIEHQHQTIQDLTMKIKHRTNQLKLKCDENTAQQIIEKTDSLHIKYTKRTILNMQKSTKKLKKAGKKQTQSPSTHSKSTSNNNNNQEHTLHQVSTKQSKTSNNSKSKPQPTTPKYPTYNHQTNRGLTCTIAPLLQTPNTYHTTQLQNNTRVSTPIQTPKLRIPPKSQLFALRNNSILTSNMTLARTPPTNQQFTPPAIGNHQSYNMQNTITPNINKHIQSQIQNFLIRQAPKHHK